MYSRLIALALGLSGVASAKTYYEKAADLFDMGESPASVSEFVDGELKGSFVSSDSPNKVQGVRVCAAWNEDDPVVGPFATLRLYRGSEKCEPQVLAAYPAFRLVADNRTTGLSAQIIDEVQQNDITLRRVSASGRPTYWIVQDKTYLKGNGQVSVLYVYFRERQPQTP